jgi:hypothetical protein
MTHWPQPHPHAAPDSPPTGTSDSPDSQPIPYATVLPPTLERNRRGGLIAFGVVSILIGALAAFFAAFTSFVLTMVMTQVGQTPWWPMFVAPLVNAAAATLFIWVGIASIRCKRWVRPVVISLGWATLIGGVMGLAGWLLLAKEQIRSPPREFKYLTAFMASLISIFGIVIPAAFVWFYSTAAVRQTLAAYDPGPSWTERPPLPVFAGSVNLVLGGLMTLSLATVGAAPFFGQYIEGPAGVLLIVAAAIVMFAAAALFHRVHYLGWAMAVAVVVLGFVSAMLTMSRLGMREFYRAGGALPGQFDAIDHSRLMTGPTPLVFVAILFGICLIYLVWVRQYFGQSTAPHADSRSPRAYPSPSGPAD